MITPVLCTIFVGPNLFPDDTFYVIDTIENKEVIGAGFVREVSLDKNMGAWHIQFSPDVPLAGVQGEIF